MNGNVVLNYKYIKFDEIITLNKDICPFEIELNYRLCGVIEHIGTPKMGHYISAKRIRSLEDKDK
jgi:ubiquitin C-terminal hydrolase